MFASEVSKIDDIHRQTIGVLMSSEENLLGRG